MAPPWLCNVADLIIHLQLRLVVLLVGYGAQTNF